MSATSRRLAARQRAFALAWLRQAAISVLSLVACTAAQIETGAERVALACAVARPLAAEALVLPTAGPFIAAGVVVGCATDSTIARLAADPSSAAWLDRQAAMLHAALGH